MLAAVAVAVAGCGGGGGEGADQPDSAAAGEPDGAFELVTYNVAGLPQEVSQEEPEEHIPLISPLLEPYDLVLTQEDFDWWTPALDGFSFAGFHEQLRAEVTHPHRTAQHPGPEAVGVDPAERPLMQLGDGLGILSRFPLADEERIPWEGCYGGIDTGASDCLAMKGIAVATATLADGIEVDVYTVHVEAGGTDEDQRLQAADLEQLAELVERRSEGRAVIVGGDLNLHTDGDHEDADDEADAEIWSTFLARTGLVDACDELDCADPGRIDKVAFRSGGGLGLEATSYEVPTDTFVDADGEALSDHDPVAVGFAWRAEPA